MIFRPLSTVDNTRDYARVSHSRQWSNYNISYTRPMAASGTCMFNIYSGTAAD